MSTSGRITSGSKYVTDLGVTAVKDGVKARNRDGVDAGATDGGRDATGDGAQAQVTRPARARKPDWLRVRAPGGEGYLRVKDIVRGHRLATVCEESHCPNIGECWSAGTATLMLMGAVCTRACQFCAVDTGNPRGWLDADEPAQAAESVRLMALKYVVLTSVDRDDLTDGGAGHFAACVRAIRTLNPQTAVEALTPDFRGDPRAVETVVGSGLQVFSQNVETVRRLTHPVRDPRAGYDQTLGVLALGKRLQPEVLTKSSLMLGLGETDDEVLQAMDDLRAANVDILALGQYLQPTANHLPVQRFVHPDTFASLREAGLARGFVEVAAGPLVRSSYRAERVLERNNLGLGLGLAHDPAASPAPAPAAAQRIPLQQL